MAQFLLEVFVSRSRASDLAAAEQRVREATERVSHDGALVAYVGATYVPEDETCFLVFESGSRDAVGEASRRAALAYQRIVHADHKPERRMG